MSVSHDPDHRLPYTWHCSKCGVEVYAITVKCRCGEPIHGSGVFLRPPDERKEREQREQAR